MSETNLFEQLSSIRRIRRKVALQPGEKIEIPDPVTGRATIQTLPMAGAEKIVFEIHSITANEMIEAEGMMTEKPPKVFQTQPSPTRVGTVEAHVGYDYEDPEYLAKRQQQSYLKDAVICLHGCPALKQTTPGDDTPAKAKKLAESIPGALLSWLANEIDTLSLITAVGNEEVEDFLAAGSGTAKSSAGSSNRSRTSGKGKSSKGSTAATSTTKSGKRRTTGG
jgi:hypothetical protein